MNLESLKSYHANFDLLNKRNILITGAGSGIGHAVAKIYAQYGATVILLDKTVPALEQLYDDIEAQGSPQPAIYPLDLQTATVEDYEKLAHHIESQLGQLDGILNNAGWLGAYTPFKHYDLHLYQQTMTINLHAPFFLTQACLPLLEQAKDPAIVISTHASSRAYNGAFGMAKAGLQAMLEILAHEYSGDTNMRINGIDTGPINTNMRRLNFPGENPEIHPNPEDMTTPYLYFIGPDSHGISGTNVKLQPDVS
jgi:NAD(P)-dependent dehydrogenase (short-subunit alcohol dehydrogenase family)